MIVKNLSERLSILKELDSDDASGSVEGYASVFGSVDSVDYTIAPDAYAAVIKSGHLPAMCFNHNQDAVPIGKWTDFSVDGKGLYVKGKLNLDLPLAKDVYSAMKFGGLDGLSVALLLNPDDLEVDDDTGIRTIKNVQRVPEISIVTCPCEQKATVTAVKSIDDAASVRDLENILGDLGCSKKDALLFISRAKSIFGGLRDVNHDELKKVSERLERLAKTNF